MLYASAAFLFLFLPAALGIYALFPAAMRKYVLLAEGLLYYVLANLHNPLAIVVLAASAALSMLAGRYVRRFGWLLPLVSLIDVAAFLALRIACEGGGGSFLFPLGGAVFLLSSISYLTDVRRGEAEPGSLADALLYLTFFPTIAAGPVIRYKDFVRHIKNIGFSINNFADGARRFMLGFIGYIALAAVMTEAYAVVIERSGSSIYIPFGLLAGFLIYAASFLALAGWTYMAGGVSLMFGISLPRDCDFAPFSSTPLEYFTRILKGLGLWLEDYLITPLLGKPEGRSRTSGALGGGILILALSLWIRTTTATLLTGGLIAAAAFLIAISGIPESFGRKKYLAPLLWLISAPLCALFWISTTVDGARELITLLGRLSLSVADYTTSFILISLSSGKYITVIALSLLLAPIMFYARTIAARLPRRLKPGLGWIGTILLLVSFVFTLLFFMPDFPRYASRVFEYLIF